MDQHAAGRFSGHWLCSIDATEPAIIITRPSDHTTAPVRGKNNITGKLWSKSTRCRSEDRESRQRYAGDTRVNDLAKITTFAKRYAEAWCSHNPASVAEFFAENGSLSVNDGPPAVGRAAIAEIAQGFMRDFPDMVVTFDKLEPQSNATAFHWTLTGTNAGPGGTGKRVRISGYELWKFDKDGLIRESKGHFDSAEYERQIYDGVDP